MFIDPQAILNAVPVRAADVDKLNFPGGTLLGFVDRIGNFPILDEEFDDYFGTI